LYKFIFIVSRFGHFVYPFCAIFFGGGGGLVVGGDIDLREQPTSAALTGEAGSFFVCVKCLEGEVERNRNFFIFGAEKKRKRPPPGGSTHTTPADRIVCLYGLVYKKDAPIDEVTVLNIPGTTAHTHTHGRNLHANDFLKFHYVQGGGFCILFFVFSRSLRAIKNN
jgi:hypothetical protein